MSFLADSESEEISAVSDLRIFPLASHCAADDDFVVAILIPGRLGPEVFPSLGTVAANPDGLPGHHVRPCGEMA